MSNPIPDPASMSSRPDRLARMRVVLVGTSHPGNIGAAARAMKTMGLSRLYLVAPRASVDEVAIARASGATDVLSAAVHCATLAEALGGTVLSAALTARARELAVPRQFARAAAVTLVAHSDQGEVALVFGNETSGLSNAELSLCSLPVSIPVNPEYGSLNLAAAVQIMAYELRMACAMPPPLDPMPEPASHEAIEQFLDHLEAAVTASGFHDPANPKRLLPRLRRLFQRVRLEREEVGMLRGMLSSFERKSD